MGNIWNWLVIVCLTILYLIANLFKTHGYIEYIMTVVLIGIICFHLIKGTVDWKMFFPIAIPLLASPFLFILSEDMNIAMLFIDIFAIYMFIQAWQAFLWVGGLLVSLFYRKK